MGKPSADEVLRTLIAKEANVAPATMRYFLQGHGFSGFWMYEVETSGTFRRLDFDMSHRVRDTKERRISADQLAELAQAIRASGFPQLALPAGYQPRPDIGRITVSVTVTDGESQSAGLPQDASSNPMRAIGAAFAKLDV